MVRQDAPYIALRLAVAPPNKNKIIFLHFPKQLPNSVAQPRKKYVDPRNIPRLCRVRLDAPPMRLAASNFAGLRLDAPLVLCKTPHIHRSLCMTNKITTPR